MANPGSKFRADALRQTSSHRSPRKTDLPILTWQKSQGQSERLRQFLKHPVSEQINLSVEALQKLVPTPTAPRVIGNCPQHLGVNYGTTSYRRFQLVLVPRRMRICIKWDSY